MASRASFEVACEIQWCITTPEAMRDLGIPEVMKRRNEALAAAGWTGEELCEEARRRMQAHIEELRKQEARSQ